MAEPLKPMVECLKPSLSVGDISSLAKPSRYKRKLIAMVSSAFDTLRELTLEEIEKYRLVVSGGETAAQNATSYYM